MYNLYMDDQANTLKQQGYVEKNIKTGVVIVYYYYEESGNL